MVHIINNNNNIKWTFIVLNTENLQATLTL